MYLEDPTHQMTALRLSDEQYELALRALIIMCADAVIVNKKRRTIYLTKRRVKPMKGWWWIGGRRNVGKSVKESMIANFARETGLELSAHRFKFILPQEYLWKDREQEPQDAGSHNYSYVYAVELSDAELTGVNSHLDSTEYENGVGLVEFTREKLIAECVHAAIVDFYDAYFKKVRYTG